MENIACDHPIFSSSEYRRDIVPFFILEAIKPTAKLLISDGESWIVCSSLVPHLPAWIWTADGISQAQLGQLRGTLLGVFNDEYKPCIVAKPETAEFLSGDYSKPLMRMLMTVYTCPTVIQPKAIDGEIRKATAEDTEAIADMVRNFEAECFGTEPMSEEKARGAAEKIIDNKMSFVVCRDGMPVAYAISRTAMRVAGYASVNNVYTQPEYRGRGYAASLVAHISRLILEDGKTPLLYADAKNPVSNKAYQNVGFIPGGQVLNLEFGGFSS